VHYGTALDVLVQLGHELWFTAEQRAQADLERANLPMCCYARPPPFGLDHGQNLLGCDVRLLAKVEHCNEACMGPG